MANLSKAFIPVMLTPFNDNGSVDFDALSRLTELYINAGAKGLFANCLSSEMFELSSEERIATINHVIKVAGGSVPVVATGTFGGSIPEQADFVKQVYDCGTQAVILLNSMLAAENESDEVFNSRVHELISLTPEIPLGFYECPVPYKRVLSPEQLGDFVDTGRVIYHKDTSLDLGQIKEKLAQAKADDFGLYDAYMVHAVESLKAGSAGLSCIQGNYYPELIVWLCDNFDKAEKQQEVELVQKFFVDNMDVMHNVYPIISKYFLQKRGLKMSVYTRRDVGDFTGKIREQVDVLFSDYGTLVDQLGLKKAL